MRPKVLALALLLSGCNLNTIKAVGAVANAVGALCDALAGGSHSLLYGPPPPRCLNGG
jgi:hypothetical protein